LFLEKSPEKQHEHPLPPISLSQQRQERDKGWPAEKGISTKGRKTIALRVRLVSGVGGVIVLQEAISKGKGVHTSRSGEDKK